MAAVVNAWRQVKAIGGAEVGDKTLVDALEPFAVTLQERFDAGDDLETAWTAAFPRPSRRGRPRPISPPGWAAPASLGAKSLGSPDPGATSLAAVMVRSRPS